MSDFNQAVLPFWLPPLDGDWQARYQPALRWMRAADQHKAALETQYRTIQQRFESELPQYGAARLSDGTDEAGHNLNRRGAIAANPVWTQAKQSNLGMAALHRWIDTASLYGIDSFEDRASQSLENFPTLIQAKEEAMFCYQEAERFLSRLIQEQPEDVLAWTYRARLRRSWAELIKLELLPLAEQPIAYQQATRYRRVLDSAQSDLKQAIQYWSQSFPSSASQVESNPNQQQRKSMRPIGNDVQRRIIVHHLFNCYILLYSVHKADRSREKAIAALNAAIELKPRASLLVARAEQFFWTQEFQLAAADYIESIQQVSRQIPARLRGDFDQRLAMLRLEMMSGNYGAVADHSCAFWQANPMLLL